MARQPDDEREGVQGWREFLANREYLLGKYNLSKSKSKSHAVKVRHGITAEAVFRRWFEEFLPKKFGVTSGYIVSQGLTDKNKLYHSDVIVYDKLESPVLWVDRNDDESKLGWKRAIPAEYVLAVFEVKSKLTPKSAKQAI